MVVFSATLNQTAFLLIFIVAGYLLSRFNLIPSNAQSSLSKLENYLFIPALVLGTFIGNFTTEKISSAWRLFLGSFILALIFIALAVVCVRFCSKDTYVRKIYLYGLSFSNFGFMGNAVVSALFPEIFMEYLIFTLPLWILIYLWGVPSLLMDDGSAKPSIGARLKNFLNPMFICMILGILIGICAIPVPKFLSSVISSASDCMSPVAMLLTGMTIAQCDLRKILANKSIYLVTFLRLIVFPMLFLTVIFLLPLPKTFSVCAVCSLAMPLGLNTIIIPSAYGKDTSVASGMALVSHAISCITIPMIFMLLDRMN